MWPCGFGGKGNLTGRLWGEEEGEGEGVYHARLVVCVCIDGNNLKNNIYIYIYLEESGNQTTTVSSYGVVDDIYIL